MSGAPDGSGSEAATAPAVGPAQPSARTVARVTALVVELAPVALVVVAEAAWISVFAGLFQEFALRETVLGIPAFAAFVAAGIVLARLVGPRLGRRWPGMAFGLVLGASLVGLLLSGAARDAMVDGAGPAVAAHPGGLLAGLALLRGFAHARLPLAEGTLSRLLAVGVPALALAATLGGLIGDPYRTQFLADAFAAAIVYVSATVLALAFTQLDAVGFDAGFDWRRNPSWLFLAVAMLVAATAIAIPLASVAGSLISIVLSVAVGPLLILGVATGFDRVVRRVFIFFAFVVVVLFILIRLFGRVAAPTDPAGGSGGGTGTASPVGQLVTVGLGGLLLFGAIAGILVLIALWMRRTPPPDGAIGETRMIDPGGDETGPRLRLRRFRRRPSPTTAVEAYVALVGDIDRRPEIRRDPAETPAAHAARLRADGGADLSLDLLAADYALARYGGMSLTEREDRRAVGRWRVLRRRLAARQGEPGRPRPGAPAPTPDTNLPADLEPRRTF